MYRSRGRVGNAVNSAARLAGATPGGKVWIGANTFLQVKDYINAKLLEPLQIKGMREPIQAYEIVHIPNWQIGHYDNVSQ